MFRRVDIASLVVFRIFFGLLMIYEVWRYFDHRWIERYFIKPTFFFSYYSFDWLRPWPGNGMYYHFAALGLLAACIALGLLYRYAAVLFLVGFLYVFLLDQANYLNHFYLISLVSLLMIFVPAHRSASLDVRWGLVKPAETVPFWALLLVRAQLGIAYFYAGLAKINPDWLRGEPMRMWLNNGSDRTVAGKLIPIGMVLSQEWSVWFFAYGGLLFDLLVVPALLWRRTRVAAYIAAVLFHLTNAWLFKIGIFPWFMIVATLIFFAPDWPRRVFNWPRRVELSDEPGESVAAPSPARWRRRAVVGTLVISYLAFQLLFPLRHYLYPGDVNWNEEGHRFSWHMKLRTKRVAECTFRVADQDSDEHWFVDPRRFLSRRQAAKMPRRPDMILQFAHFLVDKFQQRGYANVAVHATVYTALNGRKPQLIIDPAVDLGNQPRTLAHVDWILPLTEPLPIFDAKNEQFMIDR